MAKPHNGKIINCENCRKEFYVPLYRVEKARFCSRKCHNDIQSTHTFNECLVCKKKYKIIPCRVGLSKFCSIKCYSKIKIVPNKKFNCLHCGKEFEDEKRYKFRKYCSRACIQKKDIQTWNPSYSYVRKRMEIRGIICKCEKCEYDKIPEILGVHHIDKNRKNNSIENLIILCPNCHSIEHKRHIVH